MVLVEGDSKVGGFGDNEDWAVVDGKGGGVGEFGAFGAENDGVTLNWFEGDPPLVRPGCDGVEFTVDGGFGLFEGGGGVAEGFVEVNVIDVRGREFGEEGNEAVHHKYEDK